MRMIMKKETKHTVVYEVANTEANPAHIAVRSVYVDKAFLRTGDAGAMISGGWPKEIELTITEAS